MNEDVLRLKERQLQELRMTARAQKIYAKSRRSIAMRKKAEVRAGA